MGPGVFTASDFEVRDVAHGIAAAFIREYHYARGCSNTGVYSHGLFVRGDTENVLLGAAMWLPPTRRAAESVNLENWRGVLSLTRLAVHPEMPRNSASFLIGRSIRAIKRDRRFSDLVTYADESQGHEGTIYKATNWAYVGRTGPYPRWVSAEGRQVARQSTKSRKDADMLALGHRRDGSFFKHKFTMRLANVGN